MHLRRSLCSGLCTTQFIAFKTVMLQFAGTRYDDAWREEDVAMKDVEELHAEFVEHTKVRIA